MGGVPTKSTNNDVGIEGGERQGGFVGISNFVRCKGGLVFVIVGFVLTVNGGVYRERLVVYCRVSAAPLLISVSGYC